MSVKTVADLTSDHTDAYPIRDIDQRALERQLILDMIDSMGVVETTVTTSTTSQGLAHERIICNNTSAITITLHAFATGGQVDVIRANTGAVTIDGNGTDITGQSTQALPSRYDVANVGPGPAEWILFS